MGTGNKWVAEAACRQSLCVRGGIGGFELWPEVIGIQIGITREGTGGIQLSQWYPASQEVSCEDAR